VAGREFAAFRLFTTAAFTFRHLAVLSISGKMALFLVQLPGFDLTVVGEGGRLTQTLVRWKAN
jgi:hypothetical protein